MLYPVSSQELPRFLRARQPPRYVPGSLDPRIARAVGRRLRRARLMSRTTREALGLALGVSADSIRCYETGERRIPPRRLAAAVGFFGVPLSWFFLEDDAADEG